MSDNSNLTIEILRKAIKQLKEKDPLLSRGIQPNWVCVVNPAIVSHIQQIIKDLRKPGGVVVPMDDLHLAMGRRVFIINEAPMNPQYMTEEMMREIYAEHFKDEAKWLAEQAKKEGGEES